jgi:hypothetical protein
MSAEQPSVNDVALVRECLTPTYDNLRRPANAAFDRILAALTAATERANDAEAVADAAEQVALHDGFLLQDDDIDDGASSRRTALYDRLAEYFAAKSARSVS